jgi:uncharacterized protein Usg
MVNFTKQLLDHRLTTAEIVYHMPDHPRILQSYIWQELDIAPEFPELIKFLDFWETKIEGQIHSVTIASARIITSAELYHINKDFMLQ